MPLLVRPRRELREVADEASPRHQDVHVASRTPITPLVELHARNARDEVRLHQPVRESIRVATEVVGVGGVESVLEDRARIEHEIGAVEQIEDGWHVGRRIETNRLGPARVVVLVPGVQRDGENAVLVPLKGLLGPTLLPDRRGASALGNIEDLLIHVLFGIEGAARWDFGQIADGPLVCDGSLFHRVMGQVEQRRIHAGARPGGEWLGVNVKNGMRGDYLKFLTSHPTLKRSQLPRFRSFINQSESSQARL
jgi:hypothetical protein